ncbi:MAG TPA: lamin tail domain-containing protein [Tepidisphaeraceae bacterium]|jgi:hypothetical protein|nr:lamin tail domain-containing protein [Tepidisphaeraceae bacterium]
MKSIKMAMSAALVFAALATAQKAHAALLLTEAMPDPTGTDVDREWLEMYNSGPDAVDLTGYAVGDGLDSTSTAPGEGMGVFPSGTMMAAGQVYIIAANANGFNASWITGTFPHAKADFQFANNTSTLGDDGTTPKLVQKSGWGLSTGTLAMANGGDDIAILDPSDNIVDSVSYGTFNTTPNTVPSWVDASNATIQRTASGWVYVTGLANATPGVVNLPEPASLSLLALGGLTVLGRRRQA